MNNSELKIFNYEKTNVRTSIKNGEIWFVLKDVCDVLGIINYRNVAAKLGDDEKDVHQMDTHGGRQKIIIVNEAGLYKTIFRSDKPDAKKFMKWVTHDVLPSIRKHGAYITSEKIEELMSDPETWVKLIRALQDERKEKAILQDQIENAKPKIIFADAVSVSESDILIGELAKILKGNGIEIGQNRLFEKLRNEGFLVRRNGSDNNMPTQKAMDKGLFKIKETAVTHSDGHVTVNKTVKVTGKGQLYFINMFLNRENEAENGAKK